VSRLVRLYPQAWRDRYGAEFASLLEERPPGFRDAADTLRGAADAHLHPHLADPAVRPARRTHRIPGLLALAGGALWCATITVGISSGWDVWAFLWLSLLAMFLSLPGDYMAAHGRRIAWAFGAVGASFVAANLLPWEFAAILGFGTVVTVLGGMLALVAIRAGIGPRGRWILFGVAVGLEVVAAVPISIGLAPWVGAPDAFIATLVIAPYGLAWAVVGLRLAIRGSATFVEPVPTPTEPEVAPA
jgi:hypothetical protein